MQGARCPDDYIYQAADSGTVEVMEMGTNLIMAIMLILALSKWAIYKLSLMAVLLYYVEQGEDVPTENIIQEYRVKIVKKLLGCKAD